MRKLIATIMLVGLALPASAIEDQQCRDDDGALGVFGAAGDCITPDEYAAMFSADALFEAGVIVAYIDNGDGTVTVEYAIGGTGVIAANPLDRVVSSDPALEPDAPTVGEVLYPIEVWLERAYHNFGPY